MLFLQYLTVLAFIIQLVIFRRNWDIGILFWLFVHYFNILVFRKTRKKSIFLICHIVQIPEIVTIFHTFFHHQLEQLHQSNIITKPLVHEAWWILPLILRDDELTPILIFDIELRIYHSPVFHRLFHLFLFLYFFNLRINIVRKLSNFYIQHISRHFDFLGDIQIMHRSRNLKSFFECVQIVSEVAVWFFGFVIAEEVQRLVLN